MKKLITLLMILCLAMFAGKTFGQDTKEKKSDRKGGFAVGGYDQARQSKAPTRSMEVREEADKSLKEFEAAEAKEEGVKPDVPMPTPPAEANEAPVAPSKEARGKIKDKGKKGNAYSRNKGSTEGKDLGKSRTDDARSKQKPKNISDSGRR